MAEYRIEISEPAENDLRDILRYISSQLDAPQSAINTVEIIESALNSLINMPFKSPLVTDDHLAQMGYHKLAVKNYIIFFTIEENEKLVYVIRILYARRDWHRLL